MPPPPRRAPAAAVVGVTNCGPVGGVGGNHRHDDDGVHDGGDGGDVGGGGGVGVAGVSVQLFRKRSLP